MVIRCGEVYGIDPNVVWQLPHHKVVQIARSILVIAANKRRIAELTNGVQRSRR
jgi:hypothetical protein